MRLDANQEFRHSMVMSKAEVSALDITMDARFHLRRRKRLKLLIAALLGWGLLVGILSYSYSQHIDFTAIFSQEHILIQLRIGKD